MTLGIPETAWEVLPMPGDEVAVINSAGDVMGCALYKTGPLAITIWGNDPYTNEKEGFDDGESFSLKIWSSITGKENTIEVKDWILGNSQFIKDGISLAGRVVETESGFYFGKSNPNPFSDFTFLNFGLGNDCFLQISVYNTLGEKFAEPANAYYSAGAYRIKFDASGLPPGVYVCKMETDGFMASQTLIISR